MFKEVNEAYERVQGHRRLSAEMGLGRKASPGGGGAGAAAGWHHGGGGRPAGAGMGNAQRDHDAYRRAYANRGQRMPADAPARIARFRCAGNPGLGFLWMMRRAEREGADAGRCAQPLTNRSNGLTTKCEILVVGRY